mmetsp:Transcript_23955/g.70577  ORF Transcript_23955/g.70577 Transcript_23955/m.70577 type:complete len:231 (+) Transcript_23955:469-1161(+)
MRPLCAVFSSSSVTTRKRSTFLPCSRKGYKAAAGDVLPPACTSSATSRTCAAVRGEACVVARKLLPLKKTRSASNRALIMAPTMHAALIATCIEALASPRTATCGLAPAGASSFGASEAALEINSQSASSPEALGPTWKALLWRSSLRSLSASSVLSATGRSAVHQGACTLRSISMRSRSLPKLSVVKLPPTSASPLWTRRVMASSMILRAAAERLSEAWRPSHIPAISS